MRIKIIILAQEDRNYDAVYFKGRKTAFNTICRSSHSGKLIVLGCATYDWFAVCDLVLGR